ncbi:ABC transporter ATP-binding protein [Elioraea sp.]|uniref:ABC transporter ATP-binding protein n=1 Tax=Elioraea sp. TaxID=2185103 RepID=UPI003F724752
MSTLAADLLLRVEGLVKHYPVETRGFPFRRYRPLRAVDGVDLVLRAGETLGIVGESGCGKSTLARTLTRLEEPTAGRAWFRGDDLFSMPRRSFRRMRRDIQIVFQNPYAALDPRMTIGALIGEPLAIFPDLVPGAGRHARIVELLRQVGLDPDAIERYPHEFSGGQRQRIGIARALALRPSLIICDEPVSALDVSVQAQVVNLLEDIQRNTGVAYIVIAHDLSVVRHISHRVAVMYLGLIVEEGTEAEVYERPTHPYTKALLSAVPRPGGTGRRIVLEGDLPDPSSPPSGCRFRTRCWKASERCARVEPKLTERSSPTHRSACHHPE